MMYSREEWIERVREFRAAVMRMPTHAALVRLEMVAPCRFVWCNGPDQLPDRILEPEWEAQRQRIIAMHDEAVASLRAHILGDEGWCDGRDTLNTNDRSDDVG